MAALTISIREYAKIRGVSDTAIRKAINAGKIVEGRIFENGVPRIVADIADRELSLYEASPTRGQKKFPRPAPAAKQPVKTESPVTKGNVEPVVSGNSETSKAPPAGSLAQARLIQAQLKAKMMDVDLKVRTGELVNKDKVYSALFTAGKEIRVTFQAIPDRCIDGILSADSRNEAHTILYIAINEALETIANLMKMDIGK